MDRGVYHRSRHRGLVVPEFPGLELSPLEMLEHGITRAGPLMIPPRPEMALEFLEVEYVTIQHYGVQIDTLRYNGEALNDFRNQRSTLRGPHAGKWPVVQMLRKIETAAGFTIIDRSATPLTPTERGRDFLREALQILQAAREQITPDERARRVEE